MNLQHTIRKIVLAGMFYFFVRFIEIIIHQFTDMVWMRLQRVMEHLEMFASL